MRGSGRSASRDSSRARRRSPATKRRGCKHHWTPKWRYRGCWRSHPPTRGDLAWFEEDLETPNLGPARGSGVLSFQGGRWLLEQYVLSVTVPNEKMAAVKELLAREPR